MAITLNHTIIPARDNEREARFFAEIMGLPYHGLNRHFAPVRVNEQLTLDFLTMPDALGHHLAFDVDPESFDQILAKLQSRGVPYGNDPQQPDNGRIDHPLAARGVFFVDQTENLWEVMSPQ